jgi:hypothetical protein
MPGVRYGPDISDDAAEIVDFVKDAQARMRKGLKLSKRDTARYTSYKQIAKDIFGVGGDRFEKGKLGDLAEMARYGGSKPRSAIAKDWRTGGQMKKSVTQEFVDRGVPGGRKAGSSKTPEGTWYVGRTRPKKFRELEAKVQRRMNRNGASFGKTKIAPRSTKPDNLLAQVDKLNIAKARTGSSDIVNRPRGATTTRKPGLPIRPPLPKSAIRNAQRQRERAKNVKGAGSKGKGKTGGGRKK